MTAPMTLEGAIEEARRQGLRWVAQDASGDWCGYEHLPRCAEVERIWAERCADYKLLGTGSPNPDGWRDTLTEVR